MQNKEIENQIAFLLSAALQKCGDLYDAEDLTQETLLAALSYLAKGKTIQDMRAWLLTVMNRKFNDMLRKKYRQPTICMGSDFELADEAASIGAMGIDPMEQEAEAQNVRQAVAYLAKTYREVIVRYYMDRQSIAEIAAGLKIPEGTVKSRLYSGRERIKKGMDDMEKYEKQSYSPVTLWVTNSGSLGLNGEPMSLTSHDLIAQNILWLSYPKPVTMEEISHRIGIPAAYVEPIIQKLTDGGLMRHTGTKYYTDFMISTVKDQEKYIPEQKQLVREHFDLFWNAIREGLNKIRERDFYRRHGFDAKNSLELYFAFHCLDYGTYMAFHDIFKTEQIFPDRPDGGRWIAFGNVHFPDFDPGEHPDFMAHAYSGERYEYLENFAGSKRVEMHVYGADGFLASPYDRSPEYTFFPANEDIDAVFTKLLYLLFTGTSPESAGFCTEYLKAIPWLVKCKILREENGKATVNIPVLNGAESGELKEICDTAKRALAEDIRELLAEFLKGKKQEIPAHLGSVPLQKQYLYAYNALLFATVREAIRRGELYDGNYGDGGCAVNQPPCPMVLVVER